MDSDLISDDSDDDDDDIDYFASVPSDSEGRTKGIKRAHYDDFFDAPGDEDSPSNMKSSKRESSKTKTSERLEMGEREEEREDRDGGGREMEEGQEGGDSLEEENKGEEDSDFDGGEDLSDSEERVRASEDIFVGRAPQPDKKGEGEEKKQTLSSHEKKQLKVSINCKCMQA